MGVNCNVASGKRIKALFGMLMLFAAGLLLAAPSALAAQQHITSSGPLTDIYLNDNLACQVNHTGDTSNEFFGGTDPGACGTFLSQGTTVYGPNDIPAGTNTRTEYTLVSQSAISGTGSSSNPFKVTTVVDAGSTGLRITQVDTYQTGQEFYRSQITVHNSGGSSQDVILYHAGDCFLQNSDTGFGFHDTNTGGIFCSLNANNSPTGRILGFVPQTAGSHFYEAEYSAVWDAINGTNFPDTCDCTVNEDNGAGLSWPLSVPAGGDATVNLLSSFSPTGAVPDTNPPDTHITHGPAEGSTINDPTPTFKFTSTEANSTFECSVDGGNFHSCHTPFTTNHLSNGQHTFAVRAIDAAANVDPTPAERTFKVHHAAPAPQPQPHPHHPSLKCAGSKATIVGTPHGDNIHGTKKPDVIVARGGNDKIHSLGGADKVCSNKGNDTVGGGGGADFLRGGAGDDAERGSRGKDVLRGKQGDDVLRGGRNDDLLGGGRNSDALLGGRGNDILHGGNGIDQCFGGSGNNLFADCE
jgi:Ca2+-binding RTX toxin-like protein